MQNICSSQNLKFNLQALFGLKIMGKSQDAQHSPILMGFLRDEFLCQYCGEILHTEELTFDHVIPLYKEDGLVGRI
jgi:hypothetical protein